MEEVKNNKKEIGNNDAYQLMIQSMEQQKKSNKTRNTIIAAGFGCIFALFLVCALVLMPHLTAAVDDIDAIANSVEGQKLSEIVDDVQALTKEAVSIVEHADGVLDEASGAVKNLEQIDIEKLNEAISNLNDTVEPLAEFFSIMR